MGTTPQPAPTQTTQYQLSPEQRELMNLAMPGVRTFAASTPQRYQDATIAPFDPSQVAGQNMALEAAGAQAGLAGGGVNLSSHYLNPNIWSPEVNSMLGGAVDAAVRPIGEQLTEKTLPAIRGEAVNTGNFGSSRQGVAEGIASREASRAVGDTAAKLVQSTYDTNVGAQLKALGLLPQTQGAQVAPATTTSAVGDVRQAVDQAQIDEMQRNFYLDQPGYLEYLRSKELFGLTQGLPGASIQTTGSVPPGPSGLQKSLGGAATGASLGASIGGPYGAAIGGVGGAVLPFFV